MQPRGFVRAVLVAAVTLVLAAPAGATLRSPSLEARCSDGYAYAERTFVNWTVEGCSKSASPQDGETSRRRFRGKLEVNGMILEVPDEGPDLIATVEDNGRAADTGELTRRQRTTIVLDPLVGATRKRFVLYTGAIDLVTTKRSTGGNVDTGVQPPFGGDVAVAGHRGVQDGWAQAAAAEGKGTDHVDLPTSGSPRIFGLSLRDGIHDAAVRPQNGAIAATLAFDVKLALGTSGLSSLFDVNGDAPIKLTDGAGMETTRLRAEFPDIAVPGIGGLKDMHIGYRADDQIWTGGVTLDLGDLFPTIELETAVDATTGVPQYLRTNVDNLPPIPIGATGIVLDSVRFEFGLDPLLVGAGADATAGPTIGGVSLILLSGDVEMRFEPSFRLTVSGGARVLPTGSGELAAGSFDFVYDADGLISIRGDARFEASIAGIGIGARIAGSGAYRTTGNRFNIEASADGDLLLGALGDFNVAHAEAVVSSHGFGACTKLLGFLSGGIGQVWGQNLRVLTGCDLSDFDAPIAGARAVTRQGRLVSRTFEIPAGVKQYAIELTADGPGPRVRLRAPDGTIRLTTKTGQREVVDPNAVVLGKAEATTQLIALRNPAAGTWTLQWLATDPQITDVRVARDVPDLQARATVARPQGARAAVREVTFTRTSALPAGEALLIGIRRPGGLVELGDPTTAETATFTYDEPERAVRPIVAVPVRNGIPIPARRTVVGRYPATVPPRPASVLVRRRGFRLTALARLRRGALPPDAWQYRFAAGNGNVVVLVARPGKAVRINVPRRIQRVTVTARPIVRGIALG